jgi:hypothetical protein
MASNGPSHATERCYRWPRMGPVMQLRGATDGLEWARMCWLEVLPIASNGPRHVTERCYRWPRMGPEMLLNGATNGLEWARKDY